MSALIIGDFESYSELGLPLDVTPNAQEAARAWLADQATRVDEIEINADIAAEFASILASEFSPTSRQIGGPYPPFDQAYGSDLLYGILQAA